VKDVTDWLAPGHSKDELLALVEAAPTIDPHAIEASKGNGATGTGSAPSQRKSQATVIYDLAIEAGVELMHDGDDAYAVCPLPGCRAAYAMGSRTFRLYLTRLYYQRTQKAPNAEALQGGLALCEVAGRFDG
jgi:hypothetical protein